MKRMTRIYALFIMLLWAVCATAQSISVQVASQVEEGRKFQLTLVMKNIEAQPPSNVQLPNCTLLYGPAMSSSTSITIINGKRTSSASIMATYTFRADKASTVTIPAFTVTDSEGKKHSTQPKTLTILPAGNQPSAHGGATNRQDLAEGQRVSSEGHFSNDDMFVRISVQNNDVYEQEPVVATIKLYTHRSIKAFQMLTQPTFEGFLSEELDVTHNEATVEIINGKEYYSAILKQCVLYPQKAGKLKLSSGTYEVTLVDRVNVNSGSFFPDFRLVEKQIRTPESVATINVSPLPQPQPATFDGAVGNFTASVDLSSDLLRTNEPATYTYRITGTGNIKYLKTPTLSMPAGIDIYTPKTDIDAHYSGGDITGTYTATYNLVPTEVGTFDIPPLQFSYFNPKTRQYHTIDLKGFNVRVAKGAATAVTEQKVIAQGMTDILHIKPVTSPLTKHPTFIYHQGWYWALYGALALALIIAVIVYRRQLKLNADVRGRRLARALRKAMKRFKKAKQLMSAHDSDNFYAEINKALWGYLSDKLGIPASQLLRENIAAQLADYGVSQDGIDNTIGILDECEMARFTPMHSDTDMADLYNKVVNAVKSIENVK